MKKITVILIITLFSFTGLLAVATLNTGESTHGSTIELDSQGPGKKFHSLMVLPTEPTPLQPGTYTIALRRHENDQTPCSEPSTKDIKDNQSYQVVINNSECSITP